MSLASLLDSSSDAYVRELSSSGVCEIDSFIGWKTIHSIFLFFENHIWTTLGSFRFILCIITIIDRGHSAVYIPSCWTKGSVWSFSFLVSVPAKKLGWAQPLKLINCKPS